VDGASSIVGFDGTDGFMSREFSEKSALLTEKQRRIYTFCSSLTFKTVGAENHVLI
jgi:hypothetical protein